MPVSTRDGTPGYRVGINRFLPIGVPGRGLYIAIPPFIGSFERVRFSERVDFARLFAEECIARLVESGNEQAWTAPTVVQENFSSKRGFIEYQSAAAMSDYRYLQLAARHEDMIPVLNPGNGLIHDLSQHLDEASLTFYRRVIRVAALRTRQDYAPTRPRNRRRETTTPHIRP